MIRDPDEGGDEAYDDMMSDRAMFDPLFNEAAEALMAEMRVKLGQAYMCERYADHLPVGEARTSELEIADAYGAVGANKLARAYRIAGNVLPIGARK